MVIKVNDSKKGRVGIGTTSPSESYKLHVNGTIGATTVTQTSDITKKNVIKELDTPLDIIANAPLIQFTWKDSEDESINVGTTAQYWKEHLPELVYGQEGAYSLDYSTLGVVNSISLAKEVVQQKQHIQELEDKIKNLEDKLNKITEHLNL